MQNAVGNTDAQHEERHSLAFPALAARDPGAIALRVGTPPAEISIQPLGRNGGKAIARELADLREPFPWVQLEFQPLGSLRLGLFYYRFRHK